jgi:ClpP class serine protease
MEIINYPLLARSFYFSPLALEESAMLACHMVLWPRVMGEVRDSVPMAAAPSMTSVKPVYAPHTRRSQAGPSEADQNYYWTVDGKPGVAVIPINGMIMKGASSFQESCFGAVNPDRVSYALAQAVAAKDIKQIVLDIGSPGGKTTFTPELAAQIQAATQVRGKTVVAFTDTMIASAAEWLASQCDEVCCTASAGIGSIGTYLAFLNPKVAMQTQGYNLEMFSQGTHKGLGLPGRDINQADRIYLQGTVDKLNTQFVSTVKAGRPNVSDEALRDAKMYDGPDAVAHGLADYLVSSWEDFVAQL